MAIIIGDLHLKHKEPYFRNQQKFLDYLAKEFSNEVIVFLGDIFDVSSPKWVVYSMFKQFILTRKEDTHIITGNHDISRIKGNSLENFQTIDGVTVYSDSTEVTIEGHSCLMLPYKHNMDDYLDLKFEGDYTFCHFTNVEDQFENEGMEIEGVSSRVVQIFGHTHTKTSYNTKGKQKILIGVPMITRNLESNNPLLRIEKDKKIVDVDIPTFINIVSLKFGEEIPNKDWLYNITDAPSRASVYEKYKEENIRSFELNRTSIEEEVINKNSNMSIREKFKFWTKNNDISKEVTDATLKKLSDASIY